uniref:F-box domain-containing protein n=1 Tax=Caenorhabditis tropicalis TaxID=1561998 RepID=A0A1I7UTL0_9PELO
MDLLRLPLLVLIDVFKNMSFREKFLISFLSKRARNTLKLTCRIPRILFNLSDDLEVHAATSISDISGRVKIEGISRIGGEEMRWRINSDGLFLLEGSIQKWLLMAGYLLDTFKKSTILLSFYDTPAASALDFIKMINQRQLCITLVEYHLFVTQSSEFFPRILDECTEVTDSIWINAIFPDEFEYTPSRPFKAKEFCVCHSNNWFDLEKFMSCHHIVLQLNENPTRTVETYTSFFTNWMDSEDAPLQKLTLYHVEDHEFQFIMDAVNNLFVSRFIFVIKYTFSEELSKN